MSIFSKVKAKAKNALSNLAPAILQPTRRDAEISHLKGMKKYDPTDRPVGVLLADKIEHYALTYDLISPFRTQKLRPAGYELSVGEYYSKSGNVYKLEDKAGANEIVIEPFEVVVIQIFERLNMPEFMIARWNVAVGKAYQGLLWVGAAQVDPGFRGYLCCPIYNLSDNPTKLKLDESLAVIDFVGTSEPTERSRTYGVDFTKRKRVLLEDYAGIESALTTLSKVRLDRVEKDVAELRTTVFNSTAIIFTALGALALALFVSNSLPQTISRFSAPLLISMAALVVSLFGLVVSFTKSWVKRTVYFSGVLIALILFLYWYAGAYPLQSGNSAGTPNAIPSQQHQTPAEKKSDDLHSPPNPTDKK